MPKKKKLIISVNENSLNKLLEKISKVLVL